MDKSATQILMEENRLRCIAQSAVARAMDMERDNVRLDRHHARRDAYEIAINAASFAIQMIVENDAELVATRIERDHYRKRAFDFIDRNPPLITIAPV